MEIYGVDLRIQFKYEKIRTRKNSVFGHISRSAFIQILQIKAKKLAITLFYCSCEEIRLGDSGKLIRTELLKFSISYTQGDSKITTHNMTEAATGCVL